MTRANGILDFLSREWVVGTALSVDRTYLGGQLAYGEGVTLVWKGSARSLRWIWLVTYVCWENGRWRRVVELGHVERLV
jgi:hypothetical protein